jgi:hypothetical protein
VELAAVLAMATDPAAVVVLVVTELQLCSALFRQILQLQSELVVQAGVPIQPQ